MSLRVLPLWLPELLGPAASTAFPTRVPAANESLSSPAQGQQLRSWKCVLRAWVDEGVQGDVFTVVKSPGKPWMPGQALSTATSGTLLSLRATLGSCSVLLLCPLLAGSLDVRAHTMSQGSRVPTRCAGDTFMSLSPHSELSSARVHAHLSLSLWEPEEAEPGQHSPRQRAMLAAAPD